MLVEARDRIAVALGADAPRDLAVEIAALPGRLLADLMIGERRPSEREVAAALDRIADAADAGTAPWADGPFLSLPHAGPDQAALGLDEVRPHVAAYAEAPSHERLSAVGVAARREAARLHELSRRSGPPRGVKGVARHPEVGAAAVAVCAAFRRWNVSTVRGLRDDEDALARPYAAAVVAVLEIAAKWAGEVVRRPFADGDEAGRQLRREAFHAIERLKAVRDLEPATVVRLLASAAKV